MIFRKRSTDTPAPGARRLPVRNPRTGERDYEIAPPSREALASLAGELRAAQPGWQAAGVEARIAALTDFAAALEKHRPALTEALAADTGRRLLAGMEITSIIASIERWCADAPALLQTTERPSRYVPGVALRAERVPYPLLGAISPWNFPLLLSLIDAIPALLAGSAALIKPSEVTPRFIAPLAEAIAEVPALHAVLRYVPGDGETGAAIVELVDCVAFTGSVATGRKVVEAAARAFIPSFLELGGKDPAIVLAGSDVNRAATALLRACVSATGQACQSIERIYVHESLYAAFVERLVALAEAAPLSWPDPASGIIGPLIFERQAEVIAAHLDDARARGARIETGGQIEHHGGGLWIRPTVLTGVTHEMAVIQEETFGPLMPVMAFSSEEEAVALANDTIFGLSAAVFGPDEETALGVAARIEAGGISINDAGMTTFVFESEKNAFRCSGLGGSRMGAEGLTRFLRKKALYIQRGEVMPLAALDERGAG